MSVHLSSSTRPGWWVLVVALWVNTLSRNSASWPGLKVVGTTRYRPAPSRVRRCTWLDLHTCHEVVMVHVLRCTCHGTRVTLLT